MFHTARIARLFPRRLWLLFLASLAWFTAETALEFAIPTYLEGRGFGYWQIGLLVSIVSLGALAVDLPAGVLADRLNRGRLMAAGLICAAFVSALLFSVQHVFLLALVFMLWGAAYQTWKVPRDAAITAMTSSRRRAEIFGADTELTFLAAAVGPIIGGVILTYFGYSELLQFYALALVLAAVLAWDAGGNKGSKGKIRPARLLLAPWKTIAAAPAKVLLLFALATAFSAFWEMVWTLQPLFYAQAGLSPALGGFVLAAFSAPAIFLGMPFGRLADRHGKGRFLVAGLLAMGTGLWVFASPAGFPAMITGALLVSAGGSACMPALEGLVADWEKGRRKGVFAGWMDASTDAGFVVGPLAGGLAAQFFGLAAAFSAAAAVLALAGIAALAAGFASPETKL